MSKKENYNKRKALKVCIQCGKQDERTLQGHVLCNVCNDKRHDKFYQKAKYYQRRELFLCVHCGKQDDRTLQGHISCEVCEEKRRNKNYPQKQYDKRRSELRCTQCGKQDDLTKQGFIYCQKCRDERNQKRSGYTDMAFRKSEYARDKYNQRKKAKLCVKCGIQDERTLGGYTLCSSCGDKKRIESKARFDRLSDLILAEKKADRKYLKEHHLCTVCRTQDAYTLSGRSYCGACAEKKRGKGGGTTSAERRAELRHQRIESGLCVRCGKRPALPNRRMCNDCRTYTNKYSKEWRRKKNPDTVYPRGAFGYCWYCSKRKATPGKRSCPECREKALKGLASVYGGLGPTAPKGDSHVWKKQNNAYFQKKAKSVDERE